MIARIATDGVVVLHLTFVLFAIFGGLLALRNYRWIWLHLPALAWGIWIETSHGLCPLTRVENVLREQAGLAGYRGGFIDHYLLSLLYPPGLTARHQLVIGVGFALWSLGIYGLVWTRHRARRQT